jgi:hypothetical protein
MRKLTQQEVRQLDIKQAVALVSKGLCPIKYINKDIRYEVAYLTK